jgi:3-hydroxyisobutyrate dehydrogenase-like beta-hydroxyacid dehydrogenase
MTDFGKQSGPTVGVLHAGELGASVGALLRGRGVRVVTTVEGRGAATTQRTREAGMVVLGSLNEVVREADVLLSLVPPAAAAEVAAAYCEHAQVAPAGALYVDVNSVGPELAAAMARMVENCGREFVDAAINGLAKNLATGGTLYLSGRRASDVARLFEGAMRVRVLGDEAGKASSMKMLLSGLSKGVCALVTELALLAESRQMAPEMVEAMSELYPGIWALVERMLPTYSKHAARRADEMRELERTATAAGLQPCVIRAVARLHEMLADASLEELPPQGSTVAALVRQLAASGVLTADPRAAEETHTTY